MDSYPSWCFSFLSPTGVDKHSRVVSTADKRHELNNFEQNVTSRDKHSTSHMGVIKSHNHAALTKLLWEVLYSISFEFQRARELKVEMKP